MGPAIRTSDLAYPRSGTPTAHRAAITMKTAAALMLLSLWEHALGVISPRQAEGLEPTSNNKHPIPT